MTKIPKKKYSTANVSCRTVRYLTQFTFWAYWIAVVDSRWHIFFTSSMSSAGYAILCVPNIWFRAKIYSSYEYVGFCSMKTRSKMPTATVLFTLWKQRYFTSMYTARMSDGPCCWSIWSYCYIEKCWAQEIQLRLF